MYTAFVIPDQVRDVLIQNHPPEYERFIGHHIRLEFGTELDNYDIPETADIEVYAMLDSMDGIECFLVTVDGEAKRSDGNKYHITWSISPEKYKPVDSNELIRKSFAELDFKKMTVFNEPYNFVAKGKLLGADTVTKST